MKVSEIFRKTLPFVGLKLLLGLVTVVVSLVLLGILFGIGMLFGDGLAAISIIIWLVLTGIVRFFLMHYVGYLIKAGHIAVITESIKNNQVPNNPVEVGKSMVQEKFVTANVYFAVDKLVTGAVKQIQKGVEKAGNLLDNIPGMGILVSFSKFFVSIALGYIDECCLSYTFMNKNGNAFKSAADGVVVYGQNWKSLIKTALKVAIQVVVAVVVLTLLIFIVVGGLFKLLGWSGLIAFVLALFLALVVKFAFIDSWILVKMLVAYHEEAKNTEISYDLYGKFTQLSSSFKKLIDKGDAKENAI